MDYFITSDLFEDSSSNKGAEVAQSRYQEQLIRVEGINTYFSPLRLPPSLLPLPLPPAHTRGFLGGYGVSVDHRVYGCIQSLMKYHHSFDEVIEVSG